MSLADQVKELDELYAGVETEPEQSFASQIEELDVMYGAGEELPEWAQKDKSIQSDPENRVIPKPITSDDDLRVNIPELKMSKEELKSREAEWESKGKIGFKEQIADRLYWGDFIPFSPSGWIAQRKENEAITRLSTHGTKDYDGRADDIKYVKDRLEFREEAKVRGISLAGQFAEAIPQLGKYVGEFTATAPIAAASQTYFITDKATKLLNPGTYKIANEVARLAVRATARLPFFATSIGEDYAERQAPQVEYSDEGLAIIKEADEIPSISFVKSMGDTWIELFSEETGQALGVAGKEVLSRVPGSKKVMKKIYDGMESAWTKLGVKRSARDFAKNMATKIGRNSLFEELGEERIGGILRGVLGIEQAGTELDPDMFVRIVDAFPRGEELLLELGVLTVPLLGQTGVAAAQSAREAMVGGKPTPKQPAPEQTIPTQSAQEQPILTPQEEALGPAGRVQVLQEGVEDFREQTAQDRFKIMQQEGDFGVTPIFEGEEIPESVSLNEAGFQLGNRVTNSKTGEHGEIVGVSPSNILDIETHRPVETKFTYEVKLDSGRTITIDEESVSGETAPPTTTTPDIQYNDELHSPVEFYGDITDSEAELESVWNKVRRTEKIGAKTALQRRAQTLRDEIKEKKTAWTEWANENVNSAELIRSRGQARWDTSKLSQPEELTADMLVNEDKNGIEVRFSKVPSKEIKDEMTEAGFKFSKKRKHWWNKNTPGNIEFAQSMIDKTSKPVVDRETVKREPQEKPKATPTTDTYHKKVRRDGKLKVAGDLAGEIRDLPSSLKNNKNGLTIDQMAEKWSEEEGKPVSAREALDRIRNNDVIPTEEDLARKEEIARAPEVEEFEKFNSKPIEPKDLPLKSTVKIRGEEFKVVEKTEGGVRLQDGEDVLVDADDAVWIDEGKIEPPKPMLGKVDKSPLPDDQQAILDKYNAKFIGKSGDLIQFNEPIDGSTLGLPESEFTDEAVKAKIEGYAKSKPPTEPTAAGDQIISKELKGQAKAPTGKIKTKGPVESIEGEQGIGLFKTEPGGEQEGLQFQKEKPLYSELVRTVETKLDQMPKKALSVTNWLQNQGVKPEEIEWLGIDDWLKENAKAGVIDKQAFADYVKMNQVEVEEVVKTEASDSDIATLLNDEVGENMTQWEAREYLENEEDSPKFSQWQEPGGENYRELLLTLPKHGIDKSGFYVDAQQFKSSHFDEHNILAHVRFNDRTVDGQKVLFIEEIQSDWHQKGKEKGYTTTNKDVISQRMFGKPFKDINLNQAAMVNSEAQQPGSVRGGVPDAPFKKNWHEVALRRMLKYAADNGYDRVAWTTGEMQAARYDLSKQVNKIDATPIELRGDHSGSGNVIGIDTKEKGRLEIVINSNSGMVIKDNAGLNSIGKHLSDVIGKEITEKILSNTETYSEYSGLDLKVGGEGMKSFYDEKIPGYLKKFGKKFGAGVEDVRLHESKRFDYKQYRIIEVAEEESLSPFLLQGKDSDRDTWNEISYFDTRADAEKHRDERRSRAGHLVQSIPITQSMREAGSFPLFQKQSPTAFATEQWNKDAEEILSKAIQGVKVNMVTDPEINKLSEKLGGKKILMDSTETIRGFYDPKTNEIFINKEWTKQDTIYHEFAHPVVNHIKANNPKLYNQGMALLEESGYENSDEGLVQAIGEKGAQIQEESTRNKFVLWLRKLWREARILYRKLFNKVPTFNEFTESIAYAMREEGYLRVGKGSQIKKIYHGTSSDFKDFDLSKTADGTVWFTDNKSMIEKGEVAATGKGKIIERYIDESKLKLGGWAESDKYGTQELIEQGYDGLKLEDEGETTYQIFYPEKLTEEGIQAQREAQPAKKDARQMELVRTKVKPSEVPQQEISGHNNFINLNEIKTKNIPFRRMDVATITRGDKEFPAIRRSGFYARKEMGDSPVRDVYRQTQAPYHMALMQDGYKRGQKFGAIFRNIWLPTERSIVNEKKFVTAQVKAIKKLGRKYEIKATKKNLEHMSDVMEGKVKPTKREAGFRDELRAYLDSLRDQANEVREALGKKKIGYIEDYVPHIQKTSLWNQLLSNEATISDNLDFIIPNEKRNPFSFKRMMEEMPKAERNLYVLLDMYVGAIAKDIYITPAIENIKAHNGVIKNRGKTKASKYWDEYIRTGLVGKQHKLDSSLSIGFKGRRALQKWNNMVSLAFLTGKVSWNIATQPLSYIMNVPMEAGTLNATRSIFKSFLNRPLRKFVQKNSNVLNIKGSDVQSIAVGEGRNVQNRIYRTKINKYNDFISMLGAIEERELTLTSYIAGLDKAKQLGYKGSEALQFADLVAARTQSMYNKENRALILNSDAARAIFPFQSFSVEMFNHLKEISSKASGAQQLTYRQRTGKLFGLLVGLYLANLYSRALTGREKTTIGTFIPFIGSFIDALIPKLAAVIKEGAEATDIELPEEIQAKLDKAAKTTYGGRSPITIIQIVEDILRGSKDYLKYGNAKRLRKVAVNFGLALAGIGGGGQLNNIIDGLMANIDGDVKNVKGNTMFEVESAESKVKAPIFGVWATEEGREYWEPTSKKKTGKASIEGIPKIPKLKSVPKLKNLD